MNEKNGAILAFLMGVLVGANWPKLKKYAAPYLKIAELKLADSYTSALKFIIEQKEHFEDLMAETKIKRTKKTQTEDKPRNVFKLKPKSKIRKAGRINKIKKVTRKLKAKAA